MENRLVYNWIVRNGQALWVPTPATPPAPSVPQSSSPTWNIGQAQTAMSPSQSQNLSTSSEGGLNFNAPGVTEMQQRVGRGGISPSSSPTFNPATPASTIWNIGQAQSAMTPKQIQDLSKSSGTGLNFNAPSAQQSSQQMQSVYPAVEPVSPTTHNTYLGAVKAGFTGNYNEWLIKGRPSGSQTWEQQETHAQVPVYEDEHELDYTVANPFADKTVASQIWGQMQGILAPYRQLADRQAKDWDDMKKKGFDFIENDAAKKQLMLSNQLRQAELKKERGVDQIRGTQRMNERQLEESLRRNLRYLKGALAQRGAYGTTGTGDYSMAHLMSEYDIKNAELRWQAQSSILDLQDKYTDVEMEILNNQMLTDSDRMRLLIELDKEAMLAVNSIMMSVANQEVTLSKSAYEIAFQKEEADAERERQKAKQLRDYLLSRAESGEFISSDVVENAIGGDSTLKKLYELAHQTGQENISRAVTNVYENMLGADWSTKVNSSTGKTYKDESTDAVRKLVNEQQWKLEDALNAVRSAIANSDEYKRYQASKFAVKSGSGTASNPTKGATYVSGDKRTTVFYDKSTGAPFFVYEGSTYSGFPNQYAELGGTWKIDTSALSLDDAIKALSESFSLRRDDEEV